MAIGSGVPYNQHTGNGVSTTFAYGFTLLDQDDLVVTIDGVVTSAYTVTGLGVAAGGTVVFSVAPANLAAVFLQRVIQLVRSSDYQTNGDLLANTVNDDFDRPWMAIQGLSAKVGGAVRAPYPEQIDELPSAADRADTFLRFNTSGQPVVYPANPTDSTALAADLASTASDKGASLVSFESGKTVQDLASTASGKGAGLVGMETAGTLADLVTSWRKWVTVTDPRFGGIDSGSWHTAINAAGAYAATNGCGVRFLPQTGGYPTTAASAIPANVPVDMTGTYITYSGTRPAIALTIGTLGSVNAGLVAKDIDVRAGGTLAWPGTLAASDDIGVRFADPHESFISVHRAEGFTQGYELYGSAASGCAYNTITVGALVNNKIGETLKTFSASGFVNENLFIGGKHTCSSAANALGDAYGTTLSWDKSSSYRGQNNNVWLKPSYELGNPGAGNRIPVLFDGAGGYNRWIHPRHESNRGVFAYCDGGSGSNVVHNVFEIGYSSGVSPVVEGITELNGAYNNIYRPTKSGARADVTWNSGEVAVLLSGVAANTMYVSGALHIAQNSSSVVKSLNNANLDYGYENGVEYFRANGATVGVGVFLDVRNNKNFQIALNCISGFPGRIGVQCYSSAGAIMTGTTPSYVLSDANLSYSASYGGAYVNGSDSFTGGMFTFNSGVAYARIFFVGGTNQLKLVSFSITAIGVLPTGNPVSVYSGLSDDPTQKLSTAKPDTAGECGRYSRGNMVLNASAAAGVAAGWSASTAGRLAKAWAISTAYVVGQVRKNGSNVYVCTVAGTSAGAGGPTGTGTGIADNTVTWDYLCPVAVFVTMANLS